MNWFDHVWWLDSEKLKRRQVKGDGDARINVEVDELSGGLVLVYRIGFNLSNLSLF